MIVMIMMVLIDNGFGNEIKNCFKRRKAHLVIFLITVFRQGAVFIDKDRPGVQSSMFRGCDP